MDHYEDVPEFCLTIVDGGETGQRFIFKQPEVTLGRIADNDLVLYDPAVSRRHIVIYYRNQQFIVEDLGSSNGSLLNGYVLTHPTVLCESDLIEIGAVQFQFSESIEETDDPTEVEVPTADGPARFNIDPAQEPLVRRWDGQSPLPAPPEGDTRTFQAHGSNQAAPQPNPVGYAPGQHGGQRPEHLPPVRHTQPTQQRALAPPSQSNLPSAAPSFNNLPSAGPPAMPHPNQANIPTAPPPQSHPPRPAMQPPTARPAGPAIAQPRPATPQQQQHNAQAARRERKLLRQEKRHMQFITLWSFLLLAATTTLWLVPIKTSNLPNSQEKRPIPITKDITKKVFGYNQYSQKKRIQQYHQVTFQFFYRTGRVSFSYQVISQFDPVQVYLNGKSLVRLARTGNNWIYKRHFFPLQRLKPYKNNLVTFRRISNFTRRTWGLTQINLNIQKFPSADPKQAQKLFQQAQALYKDRNKHASNRYKAIQTFRKAQDYIASLPSRPALYKQADFMISQIKNELESIYHQRLQRARLLKNYDISRQIYKQLLDYFPDANETRNRRIRQLRLRELRKR